MSGVHAQPLQTESQGLYSDLLHENSTALSPGLTSENRFPEDLHLTLRSNIPVYSGMQFIVGERTVDSFQRLNLHRDWRMPAPTEASSDWNFIEHTAIGKSGLDTLGDLFDVDEAERPWSTTTTVHLLSGPENHFFVPFASVAHEVDSSDLYNRFGIGGGAMLNISRHASIGAEFLYFGDRLNETMTKETRAMARLQIEF